MKRSMSARIAARQSSRTMRTGCRSNTTAGSPRSTSTSAAETRLLDVPGYRRKVSCRGSSARPVENKTPEQALVFRKQHECQPGRIVHNEEFRNFWRRRRWPWPVCWRSPSPAAAVVHRHGGGHAVASRPQRQPQHERQSQREPQCERERQPQRQPQRQRQRVGTSAITAASIAAPGSGGPIAGRRAARSRPARRSASSPSARRSPGRPRRRSRACAGTIATPASGPASGTPARKPRENQPTREEQHTNCAARIEEIYARRKRRNGEQA